VQCSQAGAVSKGQQLQALQLLLPVASRAGSEVQIAEAVGQQRHELTLAVKAGQGAAA
jgi:hypothetical protein